MRLRTAVDVDLTAFHSDPVLSEGRHAHTWNVELVFDGEPLRDGRALRAGLEAFLAVYQDRDLPPELWSGEALARHCLILGAGDPIGCVIRRPGFKAEAWR